MFSIWEVNFSKRAYPGRRRIFIVEKYPRDNEEQRRFKCMPKTRRRQLRAGYETEAEAIAVAKKQFRDSLFRAQTGYRYDAIKPNPFCNVLEYLQYENFIAVMRE
jgi:hypothetical protein